MTDVDLIPHDYRIWISQQSMLRRYTAVIVALNVLLLMAGLYAQFATTRADSQLQRLQSENAVTQQQQLALQQLKDQQLKYQKQLWLLQGLRAGAAIDQIFAIVDTAILEGDLWFLDWSFRRAGVIVNGEPRGVETGYFVIVPEGGNPIANQGLQVATHMTIIGQAKDHQALSAFVRALFEQDDVIDVNVKKTSQALYANRRVVDFSLTVVLNSALRES